MANITIKRDGDSVSLSTDGGAAFAVAPREARAMFQALGHVLRDIEKGRDQHRAPVHVYATESPAEA